MSSLGLYVSVPVACFRVAQARELFETYPVPPPATVYGMLLSLVGEENRLRHEGAEVAYALVSRPGRSVVLRTLWRVKDKNFWKDPLGNHHIVSSAKKERDAFKAWVAQQGWTEPTFDFGLGQGANSRPDFQELLSDVRLTVWIRPGSDEEVPSLAERVASALENPGSVHRFGGLSLGESTHLVDEVRLRREGDPSQGRHLVNDLEGDLSLPIWPDHVGSQGTTWGQFRLIEGEIDAEPPSASWTVIARRPTTTA
jgi:CRISPR-associated protein Cas5t